MQQCTCTTTQHDNHRGGPCNKPAATNEAYCQECQDRTERENADTKPDILSYQPR